jgi:Cu2+-exporting ATPase
LIYGQGLERFYQFRTAAQQAPDDARRDWHIFDREQAQRRYTHVRRDRMREASLQIDGIHCAACAWLIENSLRQMSGMVEILVNPASARAELIYDPAQLTLSSILRCIHTLGYQPQPLSFSSDGSTWVNERRQALRRLGVAGFGMMQVMTYAVSLYVGAMAGIAPDLEEFLRFVSMLVATPVVLYAAQPFFIAAFRGLRARTLGMDLPVALSIGIAYVASVTATLRGHGAVYFDSAVMFTFFLLLGRFVEMSLRHRCGLRYEAIARLLPDSVLRMVADRDQRVMPEELCAGDRVRVLPGERIAADGEILTGRTEVDESLVTGESVARVRAPGDFVIAGTLNLSHSVDMRVTRVGQDSTLATVSRLLERAQATRPRIAVLADRTAAWFVGAVLLLALFVGTYWLHIDAARAFPAVLAILVVTCPCALSLATPAALSAGATRLARDGLLVTRGRALETLARADTIVLDKTGTLTRGRPQIDEVRLHGDHARPDECLALAAAMERHSEHPIARAFAAVKPATGLSEVKACRGRGIEARVGATRYRLGKSDYVRELGVAPSTLVAIGPSDSNANIFLGYSSGPIAEFILSDGLRDDAADTLRRLQLLGLEPVIASGDRSPVVTALTRRLGQYQALGDLRAADKLELVRAMQKHGHIVAMVGDGVNDAPVLAGADVSVAIGSGTDLAKVAADLVLLGETLAPLASGIQTARRTLKIIRQNVTWAVFYNATAVPFAASGLLHPWMAAIGMSLSSVVVVLNAMRLLAGPKSREPTRDPTMSALAAHA